MGLELFPRLERAPADLIVVALGVNGTTFQGSTSFDEGQGAKALLETARGDNEY